MSLTFGLPFQANLQLPELGSDFCREEARLKTFSNWPVVFLDPESLAKNGFYYLGRNDEVRCAFCKLELMRWVENDDPVKDHQRWAPQCPFLRNPATSNNVAINPTATMSDPAHPKYVTKESRLSTFRDWPKSAKQTPEELAEAGFYYTGDDDKTKCFYCDGGLRDWEDHDVPWEQHARWFDRCAFVQLVKGKGYVQDILAEAYSVKNGKSNKSNPKITLPALSRSPLCYVLLLLLSNTFPINCLELGQIIVSQGASFLNWLLKSMYSFSLCLKSLLSRSRNLAPEDWGRVSCTLRFLGLLSSIASKYQIGDKARVWSFPRCNLSLLIIFVSAFL